jgi:hypothetical protein
MISDIRWEILKLDCYGTLNANKYICTLAERCDKEVKLVVAENPA